MSQEFDSSGRNMATETPQPPLSITSLRGGQNDTDPSVTLPDDQCVSAMNVEFFLSALGERRNGCAGASLTGSGIDGTFNAIVHISERFPTNDPNVGEVWVVAVTENVKSAWARRDFELNWFPVIPDDPLDTTIPNAYRVQAQGFDAKHFFAYPSGSVDRLHVWDGNVLRRTGLAQPPIAPTVANEGSGSFGTTRYYRYRFIEKDGSGNILRRSEPSASTSITPSGSGAGIQVTLGGLIGEHETHWEGEASIDNATFYVISTLPVATTSFNDTQTDPNGYPSIGTLSEPDGEYLTQPAARYMIVDNSRLIGAGHQFDPTRFCMLWWTPATGSAGVGVNERLPLNSLADNGNDQTTLDNYESGMITGLSQGVNGVFFVFKWSAIYQATPTNNQGSAGSAYDIICLTKARGALPGSVFSGADEYGQPCIYFCDPLIGPSRLGVEGLQLIRGLRKTWTRVNRLATGIIAHGVYYPDKRQARWWVAADSQNYPSLGLCLQVNETTENTNYEVSRGWSLFNGHLAQAYCSAIVNVEILDAEGDIATISRRPYAGFQGSSLLQQCDLLSTDDGQAYSASITTKPYIVNSLFGKWGALLGALLTDPNPTTKLNVSIIRDFGAETQTVLINGLTSAQTATEAITILDKLSISGAVAIQLQFSDP